MGFLGIVLGFVGYVLVYAATANHGQYALAPWQGLTGDAYGQGDSTNRTPTEPGDVNGRVGGSVNTPAP